MDSLLFPSRDSRWSESVNIFGTGEEEDERVSEEGGGKGRRGVKRSREADGEGNRKVLDEGLKLDKEEEGTGERRE